jgi:trehalose 6-phosphate phosphatase
VAGVADLLRALHDRYGRVAVISGRPAAFLVDRLGVGVPISGLYGLEEVDGLGQVTVAPEARGWSEVVADAAGRARDELGPVVEPKGASLTLHFRTAPERAGEVRDWAAAEATRTGLHVRPAKASVELHPPVATDKGTVVDALVAGLDAACFLGDDVGDLPAFDALDRFAAGGGHAVRIAVRTDESPDAVLARADLVVDGPDGAMEVLERLAAG